MTGRIEPGTICRVVGDSSNLGVLCTALRRATEQECRYADPVWDIELLTSANVAFGGDVVKMPAGHVCYCLQSLLRPLGSDGPEQAPRLADLPVDADVRYWETA